MSEVLFYSKGLEPRHKQLVEAAIEVYCQWLNSFNDENWEYEYTPAHFLDKAKNEYADLTLEVIRESTDITDYGLFQITAYDGDDGGPATLYVHAARDWHWKKHATYKDGKQVDPGDYTPVFEDSYTIGFILQEFDTLFSPVMERDSRNEVHLFTRD